MSQIDINNTIKFKKQRSGATMFDLATDFGIYTGEDLPPMDPTEAKDEGNAQDWPDEDGLDAYDADEVYLKDFEVDIPLVCVRESVDGCRSAVRELVRYLTGKGSHKGTLMMVYCPWTGYGRKDVRFKGTGDHEFYRDWDGHAVHAFKLKLQVCDPVSVVLMSGGDLVEERGASALSLDDEETSEEV